MQKLEKTYRKTFQRRAQLRSGQNDRSVRIENYTQNISKLEKEIAEIRRQIVQINVDQQVFISSLSKTPITALVAVKSLYTPDLMSNKKKLDILNNNIPTFKEDDLNTKHFVGNAQIDLNKMNINLKDQDQTSCPTLEVNVKYYGSLQH